MNNEIVKILKKLNVRKIEFEDRQVCEQYGVRYKNEGYLITYWPTNGFIAVLSCQGINGVQTTEALEAYLKQLWGVK